MTSKEQSKEALKEFVECIQKLTDEQRAELKQKILKMLEDKADEN